MQDPIEYCREMVAEDDHRRYQSLLFGAAAKQPFLFALYAFNMEVAKTREQVSEPMIGEIRLQWWREALDGIKAGSPREHPVVQALAKVPEFESIAPDLEAVIDARSADLYEEGPENFGALAAYVAGSGGALGAAAATIMAGTNARALGFAAGEAYAMTGLIKAMAHHLSEGRQSLPQADLGAAGLDPARPVKAEDAQALQPIIRLMQAHAEERIALVADASKALRRQALPLVLQTREARATLKALTSVDHDPFRLAALSESPLKPLLRYLGSAWTKKP